MRNQRFFGKVALIIAAAVGVCGVLAAGERCDIVYSNDLDETIVSVRVKYATPRGEPRYDFTRFDLPAGGERRIGVQGTTHPEVVIIDLATRSYVFKELTGLKPNGSMAVEIDHKDGRPLLRRTDAEGEAEGVERNYLTAANRPNAVDKDDAMDVQDMDELDSLIRERVEEAGDELGELVRFTVDAGPIWNQAHAVERCPEVAREWSENNGREARWTGGWWTTIPGRMSVCEYIAGTADVGNTLFREDDGWGKRTIFPVFWFETFGVGSAMEAGEGDGPPVISMRFRLSGENRAETVDEYLSDLRADGFSIARLVLAAAQEGDDDVDRLEVGIDFSKEDGDKWDAHDRAMEELTAGLEKDFLKAELIMIESDAFEAYKADGKPSAARGVVCIVTGDLFEAHFLPDGMMYLD